VSDFQRILTDESGNYRADMLPADTAIMNFESKGAGDSRQQLTRIVQLPSQGSVRVDVALEGGVVVGGHVEGLDPSETAMAALFVGHIALPEVLTVEFFSAIDPGQGAPVEPTTGEYRFNGVDTGDYTLIIASYPTNDNDPEPAGGIQSNRGRRL